MKYPIHPFAFFLFLLVVFPVQSQVKTVIYDGISGMEHCHILDDTVIVLEVVRNSPAWEAGIQRYDRVIFINDSSVSRPGLTLRLLN